MLINIYHCVAIGGLVNLEQSQPKPHTRKARISRDLGELLLNDLAPQMPPISDATLSIGQQVINAMAEAGTTLTREMQIDIEIIVLNLVSFCMDELPCSKKHKSRLRQLFECYPGVDQYDAIRTGHRVWERMTSEYEISAAMEV